MDHYQLLEREWAEWNDLDPRGMVVCSSGTAALHLALESLELRRGNVLLPEFTMVACARAVVMAGLHPLFVDCRESDLLMDPELVRFRMGRNTRAIMAVHVYGRRCNMDALSRTATRGRLALVEDLAEAHGIRPHERTDAACWSFYRNKVVAGEEGGAVWFRDPRHATLARQLRTLGFTDSHDFLHVARGHNYRMSNAHAALIRENLQHAHVNIRRRREVEQMYNAVVPSEMRMPHRDVPWVYDLRIRDTDLTKIIRKMSPFRHGFKPMSMQPEFGLDYKHLVAYRMSREIMYLPLTPDLDLSYVTRMWNDVRELINL